MALTQPTDPGLAAEREFQTVLSQDPHAFRELIDQLVIVRRLREVRALDAFTRIDAPPDLLLEDDEALQRVRRQWLGQTCVIGDRPLSCSARGFSLTLGRRPIAPGRGTQALQARRASLAGRTAAGGRPGISPMPSSRLPFRALHSLAHMMITALSLDCGYSSTSIRERIYSSADPLGRWPASSSTRRPPTQTEALAAWPIRAAPTGLSICSA